MKDDKPQSELEFRSLSQADKDLVGKMVKGGSGNITRRHALKLAMATGVSLMAAELLLSVGTPATPETPLVEIDDPFHAVLIAVGLGHN